MFCKRIFPLVLILILTVTATFYGQNPITPKTSLPTPKPVNNSQDFIDGKTIVAEVIYRGLAVETSDFDDYISEMTALPELLKQLRENRTSIIVDHTFDSLKVEKTIKVIKEHLANFGYLDAKITALREKLPENRMKLVFSIDKGPLAGISKIYFTGQKVFTNEELLDPIMKGLGDDWRIYDKRKLEYYIHRNVLNFMWSKGFTKAKINQISPRLTDGMIEVVIDVTEGPIHRYGKITVEGVTVFSEKEIIEMLGHKPGDIIDATEAQDFLYEKLAKLYKDRGYVQFAAEPDLEFVEPANKDSDPTVNIRFIIDEGSQFKVVSINFEGISKEEGRELKASFPITEGDIYNMSKVAEWFKKLNESEKYKFIDADRDVELWTDEESKNIKMSIKVSKRDP
jgi:outer membrane protein insertion porin family